MQQAPSLVILNKYSRKHKIIRKYFSWTIFKKKTRKYESLTKTLKFYSLLLNLILTFITIYFFKSMNRTVEINLKESQYWYSHSNIYIFVFDWKQLRWSKLKRCKKYRILPKCRFWPRMWVCSWSCQWYVTTNSLLVGNYSNIIGFQYNISNKDNCSDNFIPALSLTSQVILDRFSLSFQNSVLSSLKWESINSIVSTKLL